MLEKELKRKRKTSQIGMKEVRKSITNLELDPDMQSDIVLRRSQSKPIPPVQIVKPGPNVDYFKHIQ